MKQPAIEFSRPLKVDRVPKTGSVEEIAADAKECAALARRLDVPAIHRLAARLTATPWRGGGLKLQGEVTAELDRVSVVSLETFRAPVSFPLLRYYLPEGAAHAGEEEDADPIVNGHVDLGEAVAETMALELDPYPRQPGEDFAAGEEGPQQEVAVKSQSPFAALAKMRKT